MERFEWHSTHNYLSDAFTGFHRQVSIQDMAFRIHEDVSARLSTAQLRTLVGVGPKKAFDNVHHKPLLNKLIPTQPCVRMTVR